MEKVSEKARKSVSSLKLNKEKSELESLPESGQWNSADKTRIQRELDLDNQDPGVNSDNEDDELEFKTLTNQGLAKSLNRFEGVKSSTEEHRIQDTQETQKKSIITTPQIQNASKKVSRSSSGRELTAVNERDNKLTGNKASIPNREPAKFQPAQKDILNSSQSSLPSYNEATAGKCKRNEKDPVKKKIIPVQSDFESSPSPEYPSSPLASPPAYQRNRFRMSKSSFNLAQQGEGEMERKKKSLGLKLKSS
eukprot:GFUD01032354.1.p1 GENE.GFUD01032354.1~~GFUD01032354.1.p1  ORF type:complete len:264 (+),score=87.43 GFUD01032354.1:41-793(+)